jgi:glucose/arabinose dehydrogenase
MKRAAWTSVLAILSILAMALVLSSCTPQPAAPSTTPTTPDDQTPSTPSTPKPTPEPEPTGPVTTVTTTVSEWDIKLDKSTVPAGNVKFIVTNNGPKYPHALRVVNKATGKAVGNQVAVSLDEVDSVTIKLDPGTYEVYCPLSGHKEKGVTTTLTVQ